MKCNLNIFTNCYSLITSNNTCTIYWIILSVLIERKIKVKNIRVFYKWNIICKFLLLTWGHPGITDKFRDPELSDIYPIAVR